ncbi:hypothetical protein [Xanthomonas oryzae]|uniref:Lipoprotein n=1 Tax=Xanthomonas oryzae pv. oryzae TaxID=64187 RepID=A0AAJ5MFB2_XANOO|nr:hypothetical protein [Xanthomonas oryzae]QIE21270.1 hypothetical protein IXO704_021960 [Xanthomonas oryzae pv. oryzae]UXV80329.1 hypothetical protein IXO842_020610 [Xanthomonas oryzae pv. oryzae]UXW02942.1 hypothetical protein IXO792_20795 [Xanthomonas oryzae pv. oryzae]UXW16040.1 hypothetical protein IXO365_021130 [Xanthomonas oryzae pv. oryzae]UXW19847.1 hypothetical protein IXO493_021110 [Xanthomonas oryzae pv. oryzae]
MKNKIFVACIAFIISGCSDLVLFQPNPNEYEMWSAAGASQIDVEKAMLECGYPTPFSIANKELNLFPSSNEVALMGRCMEKSGFVYADKNDNACKGFRGIPACQPDAIIPRRELSRRINSPFCKKYTKADACAP